MPDDHTFFIVDFLGPLASLAALALIAWVACLGALGLYRIAFPRRRQRARSGVIVRPYFIEPDTHRF